MFVKGAEKREAVFDEETRNIKNGVGVGKECRCVVLRMSTSPREDSP